MHVAQIESVTVRDSVYLNIAACLIRISTHWMLVDSLWWSEIFADAGLLGRLPRLHSMIRGQKVYARLIDLWWSVYNGQRFSLVLVFLAFFLFMLLGKKSSGAVAAFFLFFNTGRP
jgi:hypothetical protein